MTTVTINNSSATVFEYTSLNAPLLPKVKDLQVKENGKYVTRTVNNIFSGNLVIVFTVPDLSTTTSREQLESFIQYEKELYELGVGKIVCLARDKIGVMTAWRNTTKVRDRTIIQMVSDPSGNLLKPLDLKMDIGTHVGGTYKRSVMLLENGEIRYQVIEDKPENCVLSSALIALQIVQKIMQTKSLLKILNEEKKENNPVAKL